jgi:hypothetical protein
MAQISRSDESNTRFISTSVAIAPAALVLARARLGGNHLDRARVLTVDIAANLRNETDW